MQGENRREGREGKDDREQERQGELETHFPTLSSKRNFTVLPDICMDFKRTSLFYVSRGVKQNQYSDNDVHSVAGFLLYNCSHT